MQLRSEDLGTPVWRIWLVGADRAHKALTPAFLAELEALLRRADGDPRCRVVVLASDSGEFCRGMDLHGLAEGQHADYGAAIATYARCLELLRTIRPATLCVIETAASGGGVGLVAASDLVIAGRPATFVLPELLLGLMPAVVLPVLAERVGSGRARRLCLTGELLSAADAAQIGLVDVLADEAALTLAATLKHLLRVSPDAVGRLKRHLDLISGMPREAALQAGAARTATDLQDPQIRAAIAGFVAGEMPPWSVRYRPGGHG
ncbi:MAG: enoyl-CoA hydratase/isomerase family protein [Myxococcales bacterium]|nr:enoyl-CoA hydratase/isomerase family protein [Myxococcales bacterium]